MRRKSSCAIMEMSTQTTRGRNTGPHARRTFLFWSDVYSQKYTTSRGRTVPGDPEIGRVSVPSPGSIWLFVEVVSDPCTLHRMRLRVTIIAHPISTICKTSVQSILAVWSTCTRQSRKIAARFKTMRLLKQYTTWGIRNAQHWRPRRPGIGLGILLWILYHDLFSEAATGRRMNVGEACINLHGQLRLKRQCHAG